VVVEIVEAGKGRIKRTEEALLLRDVLEDVF
jgi:hypothetical protein